MARNLRSRGRGKAKEASEDDLMDLDLFLDDVEMRDESPEASPSPLAAKSRIRRTRSHASSHTISQPKPPVRQRRPRRKSLPAELIPPVKQPIAYKHKYDSAGQPPGYVRKSAPLVRQSFEERWPYGVISGGIVIRMLEDLSRSSLSSHWQVCIWLDSFAARFGRFHNSDGLIAVDAQETYMLMLARRIWIDFIGENAEGDTFWVTGLEPRNIGDADWEANAKRNLPELPDKHLQKPWLAADMQYLYHTILRPRKGKVVFEKWTGGAEREWEIWQA
jgi:hypothetical protein